MVEDIRGRLVPEWLSLDINSLEGRVVTKPSRDLVGTRIEDRLIIEYYSR